VQFQKIPIPTPKKVNGKSEGGGDLKSDHFKENYQTKPKWVFKPKNLPWEEHGVFLFVFSICEW